VSEQPWASDVPVSMPEPLPYTGHVEMQGFVFTDKGLFHNLSEADHEAISRPTYGPDDPSLTEVIDSG
jgi:hypothetical protein